MTALSTLLNPLKRELAVPGGFDAAFPEATSSILTGALADGFAEAQLDGYFPVHTLDLPTNVVDPDLSLRAGALVVTITATRIIRTQLRTAALTGASRYKAGPVEYETNLSTNLLRDELKYLMQRRTDILTESRRSNRTVYVMDGYAPRALASLGSFYGHELRG